MSLGSLRLHQNRWVIMPCYELGDCVAHYLVKRWLPLEERTADERALLAMWADLDPQTAVCDQSLVYHATGLQLFSEETCDNLTAQIFGSGDVKLVNAHSVRIEFQRRSVIEHYEQLSLEIFLEDDFTMSESFDDDFVAIIRDQLGLEGSFFKATEHGRMVVTNYTLGGQKVA